MTRIFDASSIWEAVLLKRSAPLLNGATISLASYELGNILWKNASKRIIDAEVTEDTRRVVNRILSAMQVIELEEVSEDVLQLALREKIVYYDASYLQAAISMDAELVTEDRDLATAASRNGITTFSVRSLI